MTVASAAPIIGTEAHMCIENLLVRVKILDVREVFGRTDFRVCPIEGSGAQWVSADRVRFDKQT